MKTTLLILLSSVVIILASWLTFFSSDRYGTHGDSASCGKNRSEETFVTATAYLFMTQTDETKNVTIGTCPYENFTARTLALELWIPAFIFGFMSYKRINNSYQNREIR